MSNTRTTGFIKFSGAGPERGICPLVVTTAKFAIRATAEFTKKFGTRLKRLGGDYSKITHSTTRRTIVVPASTEGFQIGNEILQAYGYYPCTVTFCGPHGGSATALDSTYMDWLGGSYCIAGDKTPKPGPGLDFGKRQMIEGISRVDIGDIRTGDPLGRAYREGFLPKIKQVSDQLWHVIAPASVVADMEREFRGHHRTHRLGRKEREVLQGIDSLAEFLQEANMTETLGLVRALQEKFNSLPETTKDLLRAMDQNLYFDAVTMPQALGGQR